MNVQRVANFINNSKCTQSVLKHINKNPALYNATSAFILASVMRPMLIGCFPFKDKKDKTYSQASSVAAGIVGLGASVALFLPLNKSIEKASKTLYNTANTVFKDNAAVCRSFKSLTNRGIKVLSLIPISLLRFSLVRPVVDILFGGKHESK